VYLSKGSPVFAGKQVPAKLLDEEDTGFYIVPKQEKRAIFLPRSAVALIYFPDRPSDFTLLRTGAANP
jgi:hypothetical protein